jgi:ABC-type sugar transport system ATPase subunit
MYEQAAQPLRDLGVDLDPRTKVRGLTVAQLQMVEIAKALSFDAQVLIMDEPTSALTLTSGLTSSSDRMAWMGEGESYSPIHYRGCRTYALAGHRRHSAITFSGQKDGVQII